MSATEFWAHEAAALADVAGDASIGLHVTLTDQTPIGTMPVFAPDGRFPSMPNVYRAGVRHTLPLEEIRQEIERQLARFVDHYGAPPAHIDGHHHVHQLPGVRDIVIDIAKRIGGGRVWVRFSSDTPAMVWRRGVAVGKAMTIGAFGRGIRRRARRAGVPINRGFSGAYDFLGEGRPLPALFERFLLGAGENMLVMCHPGYSDEILRQRDVMTAAREAELRFLMSDDWAALLRANDLDLGPYRLPG